MLIICKSCKKVIDTNKHDFCPRCGSNFNYGENLTTANHTADYEEYERRMAEQQRAAVENRMNNTEQATKKETQQRLKNQAKQAEGKKNGCIGCFAVVIFLIVYFGTILYDSDFDVDEFLYENFGAEPEITTNFNPEDYPVFTAIPTDLIYESIENEKEEEYLPPETEEDFPEYYILAGETAYTEKYAFTCTEVAEYENDFIPPDDGYKYISFTFTLENTTNEERSYYVSPSCLANGEDAEMVPIGGMFIPGILASGEVYESTVVFMVPENAVFFDIYYGNDVVIYTSVADIEGYQFDEDDWQY